MNLDLLLLIGSARALAGSSGSSSTNKLTSVLADMTAREVVVLAALYVAFHVTAALSLPFDGPSMLFNLTFDTIEREMEQHGIRKALLRQ